MQRCIDAVHNLFNVWSIFFLEMLIDQLTKNTYECMICCNVVRREAAIWNCSNCFHIFHLYCIKRWANSSSAVVTGGDIGQNCWRCPACQNPTSGFPNSYMCFCGKFNCLFVYQRNHKSTTESKVYLNMHGMARLSLA